MQTSVKVHPGHSYTSPKPATPALTDAFLLRLVTRWLTATSMPHIPTHPVTVASGGEETKKPFPAIPNAYILMANCTS